MAIELPAFTAFVARMPDAEIHLAAYGSIVFAISLVIEAPVIMLLAASTALSTDWRSFQRLRRFTYALCGALTVLHVLVAFTPLYDFVVHSLLKAPPEIVEPGRAGLRIMTPWTAAIGYRRFHQGVLIRFHHTRPVAMGTALRLLVLFGILEAGRLSGAASGIVTGTAAVACAVMAEAVFIGWAVAPVVRERLASLASSGAPLSLRELLHFYAPLALTQVLYMLAHPMSAAAMNRMPQALPSLAAWPAVHGFLFITRSIGFAYNEVVVALLDEPGARRALRRFAWILAAATSGTLLLLAATPLSRVWFGTVSGLDPSLMALSSSALVFGLLLPASAPLQSLYQGILVHARRTGGITESMAVYLAGSAAALAAGVKLQRYTGIYYALAAISLAGLLQTLWLWRRARRFTDEAAFHV
ncbi:MAG: hypothetical protein EYC70_09680 [Planctomycetota bacterium]|nr:MAG: hypothetical protein EYC70_09680 [Planctomycetota bacterium]